MEQMRSSSTSASSANERFPAQRLEPLPTRSPSGLFSRLSHPLSRPPSGHVLMAAAALAVLSAAPVKAIADETGENAHQVIAIVETGLKPGSDMEVIDVICEALGPEISCEVYENADDQIPVTQDLHGRWFFQLGLKGLTIKDRNNNILSEDPKITGDIFTFDEALPFEESKMGVLDGDKVNIFNPSLLETGIPKYTLDSSFSQKEVIGEEGFLACINKGKIFGMSKLAEDKGKQYFVTIEQIGGTWQITEKNELPEGSDPWNIVILDNYPGGPKIAVVDLNFGLMIFEPGNMKEPVETFQYPEDEIAFIRLHPNGKFLIAGGHVGNFIIDIEDPSNYKYIFGSGGTTGFDEKGISESFLSYTEIVQEKPLKIEITKYEPNSFDFVWNGSDEDNPIPGYGLTAGIEKDEDGDEVTDFFDNCYTLPNPDQLDTNGDGIGDACEKEEPIPEPESSGEPEKEEPEESPEPQPEKSGKPEEAEEESESVTVEEVTVAEGIPDVIEPSKDAAEKAPEVVQPEDITGNDGKGDTQTPEDENTPEDAGMGDAVEDASSLDVASDGSTDGEDQGTAETGEKNLEEEITESGETSDAGNTDPVSGNDLSADAGGPIQKDTSGNIPLSPAAGNDGGCTMRINKMGISKNGNPFIIFTVAAGMGGGLALAQRRRRQIMKQEVKRKRAEKKL